MNSINISVLSGIARSVAINHRGEAEDTSNGHRPVAEPSNSPSLAGGARGVPAISEKQARAPAPRNRLTQRLVASALLLLAQFSFDLDAAGQRNVLEEHLNGSRSASQWTYDNLSRIKSETVQAGPRSSSSVASSLTYDPENRLIGVNGGQVQMAYDGDGHRVRKTAPTVGGGSKTTYYLVDDLNPTGQAQVLEEWETNGTEPPSLVRRYAHGLDLISRRDSSAGQAAPTTHYYGYDGHGSVRILTGEDGRAITDTYTYDACGVLIAQTPADPNARTPNNYLYAGEQWDSDLGLYYNRARYLDPSLGRFFTMDTFEGNRSDPLSLHKYLYAQDNPINRVDPSGHESLASLTFSIAITSQLMTHELRGAGAALRGAREMFGADEGVNSMIYGIDIATIIDEKVGQLAWGVSAALGGVNLVGLAADFVGSQGPLRFSQPNAFWQFDPDGAFKGRTIGQLADLIRRGSVNPSEVPVMFVTRVVDGKKVRLILNTRSSLALKRARVPESNWNLIDNSGVDKWEREINRRLRENGLPEDGIDLIRIGTRKGPPEYSNLD